MIYTLILGGGEEFWRRPAMWHVINPSQRMCFQPSLESVRSPFGASQPRELLPFLGKHICFIFLNSWHCDYRYRWKHTPQPTPWQPEPSSSTESHYMSFTPLPPITEKCLRLSLIHAPIQESVSWSWWMACLVAIAMQAPDPEFRSPEDM